MAAQVRPAAQGLTAAPGGAPLVFVPASGPGAGMGHLTRCLSLLAEAGERASLLVGRREYDGDSALRELLASVPPERVVFDADRLPPGACVVFDSRETDARLFDAVAGRALAVGLDEGGRRRDFFPLLFDTLPMIRSRVRPNAALFPFRPPAAAPRPLRFPFRRFLVSFGGEDRAGLSGLVLDALLSGLRLPPEAVTVVEGPLFARRAWPAGAAVIRGCRNLAPLLDGFDLVFTHYGLTAYECLSLGVPVVLCNPSAYHRRLARRDGLPEVGVKKIDLPRLERLLAEREEHERALAGFRAKTADRAPLPEVIRSLQPAGAAACPVCGGASGRALARFPLKTYFRCPRCRTIRLVFWGAPKKYDGDYFAREYKAQYGKTYLEDFDNIKRSGAGRLNIIEKLMRSSSARLERAALLDVGAAFGPFLAAAGERGYRAAGLEFSDEGAAYVRERLLIPCLTGDFLSAEIGVRLGEKSYDIITMWYVLEHFVTTGAALERVNRLLKPGGLFALATPSGSGVSFRRNRRLFLEKSPDDHFALWSPAAARRALKRYGFRPVKTVVTGHHPERFFMRPAGPFVSKIARFISKLLALGDTFEVYARKVKDCP